MITHGFQELYFGMLHFLKTTGAGYAPKRRASNNTYKFRMLYNRKYAISGFPCDFFWSLSYNMFKVNYFLERCRGAGNSFDIRSGNEDTFSMDM